MKMAWLATYLPLLVSDNQALVWSAPTQSGQSINPGSWGGPIYLGLAREGGIHSYSAAKRPSPHTQQSSQIMNPLLLSELLHIPFLKQVISTQSSLPPPGMTDGSFANIHNWQKLLQNYCNCLGRGW